MPKILILSSNPRGDLNLDREAKDLKGLVQRLGKFEMEYCFLVSSQELQALLAEHSPKFVHFCGHGAGEKGLVFQDEDGREEFVSTKVLAQIFKTFSEDIECIVLNACDSDCQAKVIVEHIDYVVGMSQRILDQAAHQFSIGFYTGLAAGRTIETAYQMGCNQILIWSEKNLQSTQNRKAEYAGEVTQPVQPNLSEHLKPVLLKKSMLLEGATKINLAQKIPPSLASPNLLLEFQEVIRQEIERKEYKDQARAVYDNFGRFSVQNAASITKFENAQRKILLSNVKSFWIEGFLEPIFQGDTGLSLDMKARPDAISDLSQGIEACSVELDDSFDELSTTRIYKEMGQGRTLLILGDPGAGKTIALLRLAQRLIERSEQNLSLPIPIVLNLSSWAKDRKSIADWLVDELREKYQVLQSLSEPWITQQRLILLLDGLDEVNEYYRNDCVRALNKFMGLFSQTEVAVCSRVRDYEDLIERLQISSAICLQPLSSMQVYQFLDSVGGSLAGLKTLLKRDAKLEQFAQNPMILNFMSVAYQGWSVKKLMDELYSKKTRNQHLFDTYIEQRLERGTTSGYDKKDVLFWLNCLAIWMVQEKQTIFLIEKIESSWLQNQSELKEYKIKYLISLILIFGITFGLSYGLKKGLSDGLSYGLSYGLISGLSYGLISGLVFVIFGLFFGLFFGLISKLISKLISRLISKLISRLIDGLIDGLFFGLTFGLIFGSTLALIFGLDFGVTVGLISVILGVTLGLIYGLIFGSPKEIELFKNLRLLCQGLIFRLIVWLIFGLNELIDKLIDKLINALILLISRLIFWLIFEIIWLIDAQKPVPNCGIYRSLKKGLIYGLISGLISGLIYGLIYELSSGLIFGLIFWLFFGLKYGGLACIKHLNLRHILYQKGRIPGDYAKFLDFVSKRLLMKKIGGGYVFFHRMLLAYIASDEFKAKLTQR